jgi:transposase
LGRSRGGFGSKLHLRCDRRGRPMAFVLTPGERNENAALPELMAQGTVKRPGHGRPKLRPGSVVGDRGYSGGPARDQLRRRGISPVIPQLKTEKPPRLMDWGLYRERNVVERLVGRLMAGGGRMGEAALQQVHVCPPAAGKLAAQLGPGPSMDGRRRPLPSLPRICPRRAQAGGFLTLNL